MKIFVSYSRTDDEESRGSFYQNIKTSPIKDDQESATTAKVIKKESDTEESVAEKVEGSIILPTALIPATKDSRSSMIVVDVIALKKTALKL